MKRCFEIFMVLLFVFLCSFSVCFSESVTHETVAEIIGNRLLLPSDTPCKIETYEADEGVSYFITWQLADSTVTAATDDKLCLKSYVKQKIQLVPFPSVYLPMISKNTAVQVANSFLSGNAGEYLSQISMSMADTVYNGNSYTITYSRRINNILYAGNYLTVEVDGFSGEVIRYNAVFDNSEYFYIPQKIIGTERAEALFEQNKLLRLEYRKKIFNGKADAYLVYAPVAGSYLMAENGEVVKVETKIPSDGYFNVTAMFTKNNLTAPEGYDSFDAREVQELVRKNPLLGITDDFKVSHVRYLSDSSNNCIIQIYFKNAVNTITVSFDITNEILVEYETDVVFAGGKKINNKTAIRNAEEYINDYMKEYTDYLAEPVVYRDGDNFAVLYERVVNGIPFSGNGFCISFDSMGNIINISLAWDDMMFPSPENAMDEATAYDNFMQNAGLELSYYKMSNTEFTPVYTPDSDSTAIIDAHTGIILNYDGNPFVYVENFDYTDSSTHYSGETAKIMADCDFYVSKGNVRLDDEISQKDFLLLISRLMPDIKPISQSFGAITDDQWEMLYKSLIMNNIVEKNEVAPEGYVTRKDAVKYLLRMIGYKEAAELSDIYIVYFNDCDNIPALYRGYIELSRAMGIIHGSGGNFYPDAKLKNGEALIMLYNYLGNITENLKTEVKNIEYQFAGN